jgi:steroid delta-isomerase-like uncharacterized protein
MSDKNRAVIRRLVDQFWNEKNSDVVDELFATDFVLHNNGVSMTKNQALELLTNAREAFPDLRLTLDDLIAEGDKIVLRWTWHGTHQRDLWGIPPTNRNATGTGITIYRFAGDRIVEEWSNVDTLGVLRQIGAVPQN